MKFLTLAKVGFYFSTLLCCLSSLVERVKEGCLGFCSQGGTSH